MRYLAAALLVLVGVHTGFAGEPYTCNMGALTEREMAEYQELAIKLHSSVQEVKELKNGFAFKLPADAVVATSQWINYERKCCPFFDFELQIAKDEGPVWLRITGDKGIKDFIRTEFELSELEKR